MGFSENNMLRFIIFILLTIGKYNVLSDVGVPSAYIFYAQFGASLTFENVLEVAINKTHLKNDCLSSLLETTYALERNIPWALECNLPVV